MESTDSIVAHTPGPWTVDLDYFQGGYEWYQARIKSSARAIADIHAIGDEDTIPEAEATARLIAAAPDLLDTLQEARDFLSGLWMDIYGAESLCYEIDAVIARASRAADGTP